jgi:hypothetical protein
MIRKEPLQVEVEELLSILNAKGTQWVDTFLYIIRFITDAFLYIIRSITLHFSVSQ